MLNKQLPRVFERKSQKKKNCAIDKLQNKLVENVYGLSVNKIKETKE